MMMMMMMMMMIIAKTNQMTTMRRIREKDKFVGGVLMWLPQNYKGWD